jgi:hypothetical protein
MYLDVRVRLSNEFWARHLVDTVAMWLKCNSTPPFRMESCQSGNQRQILCVTAETAQGALMRPEISLECGNRLPLAGRVALKRRTPLHFGSGVRGCVGRI